MPVLVEARDILSFQLRKYKETYSNSKDMSISWRKEGHKKEKERMKKCTLKLYL